MGARFDPAGYQQTAAISDQRYIGPGSDPNSGPRSDVRAPRMRQHC